MYVAYFDEVKPNPGQGRHCYIVGGVVIKMSHIAEVEALMTQISVETFESADLIPETEFHASHIYFGKGVYKGMAMERRLEIFRKLGEVLNLRDKIKLVYACINTDKL